MKFKTYTTIFFLLATGNFCVAQSVVFDAKNNVLEITRSDRKLITNWNLSPEAKPDIYDVYVEKGKSILVKYISKSDSVSFTVNSNSDIDFVILDAKGDSCQQKIKGYEYKPKATYSKNYIQEKKGKIEVSVPEVYELISVVIALGTGIK